MDSQSFDRKVAGSTVTLEIAPSAMWVPLAARTGRTFDTTPCVGLATQGLWILVLAMVTFHPVSAFGAESVDDIGFFASAVLVLGGPVIGAMFIYGLLNILRGATTWPWTTTTLAYLLWSRIPWNFAKADIASILVPLVDHARIEGGTIQFVGSDGGYLTGPKRDALVSAIEKWVKNGYKVRYILVSLGDEATSSLEALKRSLGDRLEVFVLTPPPPPPKNNTSAPEQASVKRVLKKVRRLQDVLTTCHPTLMWSAEGDRKAMWIEGDHPFGEDVSYNNQWVPPAAMGKLASDSPERTSNDVFSTWHTQLEFLCDHIRKEEMRSFSDE